MMLWRSCGEGWTLTTTKTNPCHAEQPARPELAAWQQQHSSPATVVLVAKSPHACKLAAGVRKSTYLNMPNSRLAGQSESRLTDGAWRAHATKCLNAWLQDLQMSAAYLALNSHCPDLDSNGAGGDV